MNNKKYENESNKDIKSKERNELYDVEAPPPPYESAGGAPSSTSSGVAAYDVQPVDKGSTFNQNKEFLIPNPIYNNHFYSYNDSQPQQPENFQQSTTATV